MFKKSILLAAALVVVGLSGNELLAEGAFGFEFGQELPDGAEPLPNIQGGYLVESPNPFPEFASYAVVHSEATGVCKIFGFGKTYKDDEWGIQVEKSYENLISALSKKYGSVRRNEFLRSGALYDEPSEFSRSISKNQRSHQAFWDIKSESPKSTSEILLSVNASWTDTWLYIHYASKEFPECQSAIDEQAEGAL